MSSAGCCHGNKQRSSHGPEVKLTVAVLGRDWLRHLPINQINSIFGNQHCCAAGCKDLTSQQIQKFGKFKKEVVFFFCLRVTKIKSRRYFKKQTYVSTLSLNYRHLLLVFQLRRPNYLIHIQERNEWEFLFVFFLHGSTNFVIVLTLSRPLLYFRTHFVFCFRFCPLAAVGGTACVCLVAA